MAGKRRAGSLTDVDEIDSGTLNRQPTPPPGPILASLPEWGVKNWNAIVRQTSQWAASMDEAAFGAWAREEAWTGARWMRGYAFLQNLRQGRTVINPLGADMLEMYLRGQVDPEIIQKVGQEIFASDTFGRLSQVAHDQVEAAAKKSGRPLTPAELTTLVNQAIDPKRYVDPATSKPIHWDNRDRGLNEVIGHVERMDVQSVRPEGGRDKVYVTLSTTYKFNNVQPQSCPPELQGEERQNCLDLIKYDQFRHRLYSLILQKKYGEFFYEYHKALYTGNPIPRSRVFASLLFAMELAKMTPGGLYWEVTIPLRADFPISGSHP
jgi:hypothetical protein